MPLAISLFWHDGLADGALFADGAQFVIAYVPLHLLFFLSYCDGCGLILFSLVSSVIFGKILFWDQMRYFGRPLYSGRPQGSWRPVMSGSSKGGPVRPPVGPVAVKVPSNYSFY